MKLTEAERAKLAAAIKHFEALQKRYTSTHNGTACEHVRMALTALYRLTQEPEVVRCRDCMHSEIHRVRDGLFSETDVRKCELRAFLSVVVDDDDFCSEGEHMDADRVDANGNAPERVGEGQDE